MNRWFRAHTLQLGLVGMALGVVILLTAVVLFNATTVAAAPRLQDEKPSDEECLPVTSRRE